MVAAKSLAAAGVLVVATMMATTARPALGGSIVAGGKGTLYIGDSGVSGTSAPGRMATLFLTNPAPVPAPAPATTPAPAATPAAWSPGAMSWTSNGLPVDTSGVAGQATSLSLNLPQPTTPTPVTSYDAFVNFGNAPMADQAFLTVGAAQPWAASPAAIQAFGHAPTAAEQAAFSQTVLARVESTFASSGLSITATTDPSVHADHMLSVASGLGSTVNPDAIGVTNVGHNGFDFIDKLAYAHSPDELEWAVAHNVAHELMHAFGGSHHTTPENNNLDAPSSDWSVLTDPATKFSAASVAEMTYNLRQGGLATKYGAGIGAEGLDIDGQEFSTQPVPEPATMALWGGLAGVAGLIRSRSRRAA